jgi:hypothetical protein
LNSDHNFAQDEHLGLYVIADHRVGGDDVADPLEQQKILSFD